MDKAQLTHFSVNKKQLFNIQNPLHCVVPENLHTPPMEGFLVCTLPLLRKFQFSFKLSFDKKALWAF